MTGTIHSGVFSDSSMAYFNDLTRYEYSKNSFMRAGELLNIGWIERCAPYPKGVIEPDLTAKLLALCKFPVNQYRGYHDCHFCKEYPVEIADSQGEFCLGDGEIRVPAADGTVTYVAPNLIYHYVVAHHYLPPDIFLDALRTLVLPNPAVVWILERIEWFEHGSFEHGSSVKVLSHSLDWILSRDHPSLPPELRGIVVEAANELKGAQNVNESDARQMSERIVSHLKSALAKG
jgi:hypothetical protein